MTFEIQCILSFILIVVTSDSTNNISKGCFELEWDVGKQLFQWDPDFCTGEEEAYICEFPIVSFE